MESVDLARANAYSFAKSFKRKYYQVYHVYFLKYFDEKSFIKCFNNRIKYFCEYVHFDSSLKGSKGIYSYMVELFLDEIQSILINDVHKEIAEFERRYYHKQVTEQQFAKAIKEETKKYNSELFKGKSRHLFKDSDLKKPVILDPSINDIFDRVFLKYEFIFDVANRHYGNAKKKIIADSKKNSQRNFLKEGDPSHIRYMGFVDEMLRTGSTKYNTVNRFMGTIEAKGLKTSESNIRNAFDSFLKSHRSEILERFNINESTFNKRFLPKLS